MSNYLNKIVYLRDDQYETLVSVGSININGQSQTYNPNTLYITNTDLITASPTASGNATSFITDISQNKQGKITATKASLDTSGTWTGNATKDSDGNVINTTYLKKEILTAKGDLIYASGASSPTVLNIGTTGHFLKATANGPVWSNTTDAAISITNSTVSSSSSTGAFIVSGGVGIAKALYVGAGANITGSSTITADIAAGTSPAVLTVTNDRSAANIAANQGFCGINFLIPNMIATTRARHIFGKSLSNKNSGILNYYHTGDSSDNNYVGLGLYSVTDVLRVYGDNRVTIQQNLQIPTQSAGYTYGIQFMNSTTKKGSVGCDNNGIMCMYGSTKISLRPILDAVTDGVEITTTSMKPTKNNSVTLGETNNKWSNVYATTFTGTLDGNAATASKITDLTTTDVASSTDGWRKIWISYSNGTTGRPALSDNFTYQTSTNTLSVVKTLIGSHIRLEYNSTDNSLDFIFI